MASGIRRRLTALRRRLAATYGADISTPAAARAAWWHYLLMDAGLLRLVWSNFAQVAPGVFRANQPSPACLRSYHARGIRSIISLRGKGRQSFHLFERQTADDLGMTLAELHLSATVLPAAETILQLHDLFRTLPRPLLIHCKSGSDRTGLVAALYLIMIENRPVAAATGQLSLRFLHFRRGPAGVADQLLRCYAQAQTSTGVSMIDWVRTAYDPARVTAAFRDWRAGRKDDAA